MQPTIQLAEQRFKPMTSQPFPWGEERRNALLDGGLGPAKWPQQQNWLASTIFEGFTPAPPGGEYRLVFWGGALNSRAQVKLAQG